jgi:hypothetical protein
MANNKKPAPTLSAPPPLPSPTTIEEKLRRTRADFEQSFKNFHELLGNKVLKTNKTLASNKQEKHVVDQVVRACVNLDRLNVGEGVMALSVVALREHLKVRDRVNDLEYELELVKREMKNLKKEFGIDK